MKTKIEWTSPKIKSLPISATRDPSLPGCVPSNTDVPNKCES